MRTWHYRLRFLRKIRLWHLLLLFVLLVGLSGVLLRQNNLGMIERRNIVKMTDEQGGDTAAALRDLQRYVNSHMNTNMGERGIYLEKTYQRAYERSIREATERNTPTGAAYLQAEKECGVGSPAFQVFVQCVVDRMGEVAPGQDPLAAIKAPSTDLFRYTFVSPVWSLDAAGLSVLATGVVGLTILVQIVTGMVARAVTKRRYQ